MTRHFSHIGQPVRLDWFKRVALSLVGAAAILGNTAYAQITGDQVRAANLARMEAERINGGLGRYFAANCMHQKGGGDCMIRANDQGFLFRFLGGSPGWQVNKQAATVQTEILISPDGRNVVAVQYNGVPTNR